MVRRRLRELRVAVKQLVGIEPRIRRRGRLPLEFHGGSTGGWKIVAQSLQPDSVVVDIGLGEDTSFSESIIAHYACLVHGFDPTPRAVAYVEKMSNDRLRLYEFGLGPRAGCAQLYLPSNSAHVSGSIRRQGHLGKQCVEIHVITIGQVFELVASDRIDLLKMDIEGTEYDVLESDEFRDYAGAISQLAVEFHHRWESNGKGRTESAVSLLDELGFDCAWYSRSTNEEFLFVRRAAFKSAYHAIT